MPPKLFTLLGLRRLAWQGFSSSPQLALRWRKTAARLIHYRRTSPLHSTVPYTPIDTAPSESNAKPPAPRPKDKPSYDLTFTCKPCNTRSTHRITKQGYHHGSVLITCPECKNRHIISDHLNIFMDKATTIEDIMREKGQLVKKGTLSEDEDIEFWEDGTTTDHAMRKIWIDEKSNAA